MIQRTIPCRVAWIKCSAFMVKVFFNYFTDHEYNTAMSLFF